jgi:hypothetical protein
VTLSLEKILKLKRDAEVAALFYKHNCDMFFADGAPPFVPMENDELMIIPSWLTFDNFADFVDEIGSAQFGYTVVHFNPEASIAYLRPPEAEDDQ